MQKSECLLSKMPLLLVLIFIMPPRQAHESWATPCPLLLCGPALAAQFCRASALCGLSDLAREGWRRWRQTELSSSLARSCSFSASLPRGHLELSKAAVCGIYPKKGEEKRWFSPLIQLEQFSWMMLFICFNILGLKEGKIGKPQKLRVQTAGLGSVPCSYDSLSSWCLIVPSVTTWALETVICGVTWGSAKATGA